MNAATTTRLRSIQPNSQPAATRANQPFGRWLSQISQQDMMVVLSLTVIVTIVVLLALGG